MICIFFYALKNSTTFSQTPCIFYDFLRIQLAAIGIKKTTTEAVSLHIIITGA